MVVYSQCDNRYIYSPVEVIRNIGIYDSNSMKLGAEIEYRE